MKDLIEFLAARLQAYLPLLFRIVAHPRENILTLVRRPDASLADALAFFAISSAIGLVLQAPLLTQENEFVTAAGVLAVYKVFEMAVVSLALVLVFRLLGGAGRFEQVLAATLFIISPIYLALILLGLVTGGVLSGFDPALAEEWRRTGELSEATTDAMLRIDAGAFIVVTILLISAAALVFGWLIWCWPIYGRLNEFSRWRSVVSFFLGMSVIYLVGEAGLLVIGGLFPRGLGGAY